MLINGDMTVTVTAPFIVLAATTMGIVHHVRLVTMVTNVNTHVLTNVMTHARWTVGTVIHVKMVTMAINVNHHVQNTVMVLGV